MVVMRFVAYAILSRDMVAWQNRTIISQVWHRSYLCIYIDTVTSIDLLVSSLVINFQDKTCDFSATAGASYSSHANNLRFLCV